MPNMVTAVQGPLVIVLHTRIDPNAREWGDFMAKLRTVPPAKLRLFVVTDGGGPNAVQRKDINDHLGSEKAPMAVVSDNTMARLIGVAVGLFQSRIAVFPPHRLREAFAHIAADASEQRTILAEAHRIAAKLTSRPAALPPLDATESTS